MFGLKLSRIKLLWNCAQVNYWQFIYL